jgi:pyruvate dehydrogenase E1 component alpha subunit/2-oxoisovalerate dehydrogenase E1 component alpha subunit
MAFGDTILDTLRTYLGSSLGSMRGRDGNIHRGRPREGYYAMISHLGAMIPLVAGGLLARRLRGENGVVGATCAGDGATSTGAFHEGLNAAAVEKLPLVVVVANNQYAYSTPTSRQYACADLIDRAIGYGVAGHKVDGTDLEACMKVVGGAVAAARAGGGPQLVVADLLRLVGHGEHDDASYVAPALRKEHVGRDCLNVAAEAIVAHGWATNEQLIAWREEAETEVDEVAARVSHEPEPDPAEEEWRAISTRELEDNFA